MHFSICQVILLVLLRSVHADSLSHLGLMEAVDVSAGLYVCW